MHMRSAHEVPLMQLSALILMSSISPRPAAYILLVVLLSDLPYDFRLPRFIVCSLVAVPTRQVLRGAESLLLYE